ncbi:unnamed protein product, partial [marine sediment metagenome]
RSLRVRHRGLSDWSALKDFDVLVIGRNSLDVNLAKHGPAITEWVRGGGRLLCFEQSKAGELPFLPEVKVVPGKRATFTEILVQKHPIFDGLAQEHFDDWNAYGGLLFKNVLDPLNGGMLSVGPTMGSNKTDSMKMISASYAVGEGEIVLSQYELTLRYGKDSIATRFTQNLLAYVMTEQRSPLSLRFESRAVAQRRIHLDKRQAAHVDLRGAANAPVSEFRELPHGVTTLSGDVPFHLIDPARNQGRRGIALAGSHQPDAPQEV